MFYRQIPSQNPRDSPVGEEDGALVEPFFSVLAVVAGVTINPHFLSIVWKRLKWLSGQVPHIRRRHPECYTVETTF